MKELEKARIEKFVKNGVDASSSTGLENTQKFSFLFVVYSFGLFSLSFRRDWFLYCTRLLIFIQITNKIKFLKIRQASCSEISCYYVFNWHKNYKTDFKETKTLKTITTIWHLHARILLIKNELVTFFI